MDTGELGDGIQDRREGAVKGVWRVRKASFQEGLLLGFGSEWLRPELVRTRVEGRRMIWKVRWRG